VISKLKKSNNLLKLKKTTKMKTLNKRNAGMLGAFITFLSIIILVSISGWLFLKPQPEMLQGEIEATETRISGKVPARIREILVVEGSQVKVGDTLVIMESPELEAKLMQASSAESAAMAQNRKAIKGARQEQIAAAYEMWQKAEVGVGFARKTFDRVQNMFDDGVVSAQKRDEAEAAYNAAVATSKAARAQYDMAMNGAETEDKQAALALVDRARGAVSEVQAYLSETVLLSPLNGEVSDIFPQTGELIGSGAPVMSLVDLSDVKAIFSIREDKMQLIQKGKQFEAVVPALGNKKITLKVNYIKAMAGYATYKPTKSNGGFDVKTFEVHACPVEKSTGLLPGMSVLVDYSSLENNHGNGISARK
jgi:HlyD family secretion protein